MGSVRGRAALLVAVAACAAPLVGAAPAPAAPRAAEPVPGQPPPADVIFVEVTPGTVQPGYLVGIRASCRDNSVPAIVVSDAFGRIQVQPQRGLLTASPMVNERTRPGNYRVKLECPGGETASTMLQVVKQAEPTHRPTHQPSHVPSRGPATGFGGTAGPGLGGLLVPIGLAVTMVGAGLGVAASRRQSRGAAGR
ncbi:hypothetical protein O7600_29495 [Micromonospora sp. WMMA1998]|uniref:hypothetical protein n=1 Tax=Micromonospora sp. WMMA1998 TaxID=3015167 RepID=UPI00248C004B|nr:hypothetical protein [Micromonospora sp. WMMA1998]WBC15147.1 hypothetical protein O7600_29495 [Micromonospora sp. WMMA1998]